MFFKIVQLAIAIPILVFCITLAVLIGSYFIERIRATFRTPRHTDEPSVTEEARMVQEIHQALGQMEERIESLETLLLERSETQKP